MSKVKFDDIALLNKEKKFEKIMEVLQIYVGEEMPNDYYNFLEDEIALLKKRSNKAKEKREERSKENNELAEKILSCLENDKFLPVNEILERLEDSDLTSQKVIYRLTKLVEDDLVEKQQVQIPPTETVRGRKAMGYKLK